VKELAAYSTVAMTLSLVVVRPRLRDIRCSPAGAAGLGVLLMVLFGVVHIEVAARAFLALWQPFVAIAAIMVTTAVAHDVGVIGWLADRVESNTRTTVQLFRRVFITAALTAAALNNDAAVLLLTPLVVTMVRRRYPDEPGLLLPFAFAVFMAAGVAPLVISNPINMIIAEYASLDFNDYTLHMLPVAIAGWLVAYAVLRVLFRQALRVQSDVPDADKKPLTRSQKHMLVVLLGVLPAYAISATFGGPIWIVATVGAALAVLIATRAERDPAVVIYEGISWDTLIFLACVLVLSVGLLEVGLVGHLAGYYENASVFGIGGASAVGSAVLNNHPMAHINMMALQQTTADPGAVWAVLIGGDLGPRLLPMGSLAGLLWLALLRRDGVDVRLRDFCGVGILVGIPTLLLSLLIVATCF
jgi:arsenical pump membrane protein